MYCIVIVLYCYPIYYPCALTVSLTNIITFLFWETSKFKGKIYKKNLKFDPGVIKMLICQTHIFQLTKPVSLE